MKAANAKMNGTIASGRMLTSRNIGDGLFTLFQTDIEDFMFVQREDEDVKNHRPLVVG